jgi:ribosomal protein S18 acetylase RimI-like enzyme
MGLEIREVKSQSDLKKFIFLPADIHKNHSEWVPPVYMDDKEYFNPVKNESFSHCDTVLYVAWYDEKPVGRIMGIINHNYNERTGENDARFCFLECYEDFNVAEALIKSIENWARSMKATNLVGPLGFSDKDFQGLLFEGYDKPVVIASNCNFPFQVEFVERMGYSKKKDLVDYQLSIPEEIPEIYLKIYERTLRNHPDLKIVEPKTKRELKKMVRPVFELVNETYKDIYGFAEMTTKEIDEFAQRYIFVIDPRFVKLIVNGDNELVAFVLAMPDMSEGMKKSKGYVFPFGFIHILRSQKTTKQLNLLLGAIKPEYRNSGLDSILTVHMLREAAKAGFKYIDSHLTLENNTKVRSEMERLGGHVYKRFRIFTKPL